MKRIVAGMHGRRRCPGAAAAATWWVAACALVGARELDPAACGARFDVQRDKIIRTEESREMGARYLSELDVGARHECLRLCCETDSCDVFVYEEKSPGSCYLFNCGPPEDFRCKFTAHGNFSSGVLALSRRLAELQDQERLARHEHELASLRGATSTTSTTTTTVRTPPAPPPPPPQPPDPPPGRCSRYQFECRHGGECIAVYNACDGVPQCADGSDEAPELGCPASATAPAPAPSAATLTLAPTVAPVHVAPPPPKPMQVLGDSTEGEGAARWPHRLTQAQPPQRRYNVGEASRGPHIFSHKGGLLQEGTGVGAGGAQYAPFEPPWVRRLWDQPQQVAEWAQASGSGGWPEPEPRPEPDPRRAWPVPPPREPEMPMYMPAKTMPELPLVYSSQQQTLRDGPKKGLDLSRGPPPAPPPPPPPRPPLETAPPPQPPPPESSTKKKVLKENEQPHDAKANDVSGDPAVTAGSPARGGGSGGGGGGRGGGGGPAARLAADERDGLSDHPPAAILLLVLGVGMTAVLGGVAWSRARAARRRLRRGKAPFAHDADYLVNGMYL